MGAPEDWDELSESLLERNPVLELESISVQPAGNWLETVARIADEISDSTVLVGYSMGARLALGVALEFPEKLSGLLLISGSPGLESDDARQQRWVNDKTIADQIESLSDRTDKIHFLHQWYKQSVFSSATQQIRDTEVEVKTIRASDRWPLILRTLSVSKQPNYWPRLQELSMPVTIVVGEEDRKYNDIAKRMIDEVTRHNGSAGIELQVVEQCGHIVHREQRERLAAIILQFTTRDQ